MNLTRGKDHGVYWTLGHFKEQVQLALLSYLAVAHFGRGRGEWEEAEHPPFWVDEVKAVMLALGYDQVTHLRGGRENEEHTLKFVRLLARE